jgi:hypothetical protein
MSENIGGYNANPNLKRSGVKIEWTEDQVKEYVKCSEDPLYFALNHMKIVSVDKGLVPFKMWDFQKNMLTTFHQNRFVVCKMPRQVGKCFVINTIVTIKDKRSNEIFDMTIGDFYELVREESRSSFTEEDRRTERIVQGQGGKSGLREMSLLRNEVARFDESYISSSQNASERICQKLFIALSKLFTSTIGKSYWGEKPGLSTRWKIFSIFKEIYKRESQCRDYERKSKEEQIRKESRYHENRILVEKNQWRYDRSTETSFRETNDIFFEKMYREIWSRRGRENLEIASRKMAEIIQKKQLFQNFTKLISEYNEYLQIKFSLLCGMVQRRYAGVSEQRVQTKTIGWNNDFTRFFGFEQKENNRVRWRLLAFKQDSESQKRGRKNQENTSKWFSIIESQRSRLQKESESNYSGLHQFPKLSDNITRKFIESFELHNYEVLSDSGFVPISHIHKTIPYRKWKIVLDSGESLYCADDHIVFDDNLNEIFVKDCIPNQTKIMTKNGYSLVKQCYSLDTTENMYDLSIDSEDHRFYTNGILSHNSTTIIAYLLHQIIFRDNTSVAMLANKGSTARELLGRLQLSYENLPLWLQQGINTWNKGNIELENGSKVIAASTSSSAIRGGAYKILFLDEYAFVPNNQADQFFTSVYPTISSGKTSQVLIVSTPNGLNHFYRMWSDASNKRSNYIPLEVHWSEVPGRDEKWKKETIRNTSIDQFRQEFETEFIGSSNTLISGVKLKTLVFNNPVRKDGQLDIHEEPQRGHTYVMTVDVSRGQGMDYSAYSVIDVTTVPYKQVAKFRDKDLSPLIFPTMIHNVATYYNTAYVLVEINDIGQQIADIMHHELEYDNLVKITSKPRQGQQMSLGHTKKIQLGVKTSISTKRIGCSNLKTLIESDKLLIMDSDTIMELMTFVAHRESFAAEEGSHDDLAMTLVLFAWFIAQRHFREGLNNDIRTILQQEQLNVMQEDIVPFGDIDDGINEVETMDELTRTWLEERRIKAPLDSFEYDWTGKLGR